VDHFDTCVAGAGVVGLAITRQLSLSSSVAGDILLLEQHGSPGQETSSRNSEVIHAGLYYPPGSLKAKYCVEGRERLYRYCQQYDVPHKRLGKYIVAADDELPQLQALLENAQLNGVSNLVYVDKSALRHAEPQVAASHALFSPDSGIIDSHALMQSLLQQAEANGACFAPYSRISAVEPQASGFLVTALCGSPGRQETYQFSCRQLINSAGLHAQTLAAAVHGLKPGSIPPLYLCKGSYFSLRGKSPFSHLIYPLPEKNQQGLGVHATLDMSGQVRFGPDVEYTQTLDFSVESDKRHVFCNAIQRYYPGLKAEDLQADYAGMRPKLQAPDGTFRDFIIQDESAQGLPGLIQLFGIESPGLTASLAIACAVEELLT
jgi:L-2-hydroxyglutarate oxidase LhgO